MSTEQPQEAFQEALQRLDALVETFEQLPLQRVQEQAFAMLQAVDTVHRLGLQRLVARLDEEGDSGLLARITTDPVVHTLLLLYDLVPGDHTAPANESVASPPDPPSAPVIALHQIGVNGLASKRLRQPRFTTVARVEEVPPGTLHPAALDDIRAVVVNVGGELYATGELCPGSNLSLLFGELDGPRLTCSWHGETYDVRSGRCLDAAGREDMPRLPVYPVRIFEGEIQIASATVVKGERP